MTLIARSRYLRAVVASMLLQTVAATLLYVEQGRIVAAAFADTAARRRYFAVSTLMLVLQLFVAGHLLRRFGVGAPLCGLPSTTALAFGLGALAPGVVALAVAQTLRRAAEYAVARPVREVL